VFIGLALAEEKQILLLDAEVKRLVRRCDLGTPEHLSNLFKQLWWVNGLLKDFYRFRILLICFVN